MSGLIIAAVLLAVVIVAVWALAANSHDEITRARERAYLAEVHRLPERGDDESPD